MGQYVFVDKYCILPTLNINLIKISTDVNRIHDLLANSLWPNYFVLLEMCNG